MILASGRRADSQEICGNCKVWTVMESQFGTPKSEVTVSGEVQNAMTVSHRRGGLRLTLASECLVYSCANRVRSCSPWHAALTLRATSFLRRMLEGA
jgi:hypothetical protein